MNLLKSRRIGVFGWISLSFVLVGCANKPVTAADAWKPAAGPLMTRWAKDVSASNPLPEYPRPQMARKDWTNLNGLWDYAIVAKEDAQPKDWQGKILVPYPVESALSGVMKPVDAKQKLWYHRTFEKPAGVAGGRLLLHFGAVDWQTTVSVNGKEVAQHTGGYDPFTVDITDAVKDGANELIVGVFDPSNSGYQPRGKQHFPAIAKPGGIMYTPVTGIWQTVWLEPVPEQYIRALKITPDVDKSQVSIEIAKITKWPLDRISAIVYDGDKEIAKGSADMSGPIVIAIPDAKLWSTESPNLYRVVVGWRGKGEWLDSVESYFGLRKIEVKKDDKGVNRIYLNNQPIFMTGPLDQGFWPDGIYTAPTDEALKFDIEITKKLGFNCTRKHVKVEPDRWYYWCDKLGLLVWQDMPSGDNGVTRPKRGEKPTDESGNPEAAANYRSELKALIDTHGNHPSIVMWVVFNEGWGQFETIKNTTWTKQYDPTRIVNPASGWTDYPAGDVIDMHNYPGPGAPKTQETRAGVLGEFGGLGLPTEGHMWTNKNWGYKGVTDSKDLTRAYVKLLSKTWALRESAGLNAAIYTQLTDVETEANGLLTYDREVVKVDLNAAADANRGKIAPPPQVTVILPTSQKAAATWKFTTEKPADGWFKPEFDDAKWKSAPGGFGTASTPGSVVGTEWKTDGIWIRRDFTLESAPKNPLLLIHHDEDAEVYINGILAAKTTGFISDYEESDITPEARAALKSGKNSIAVHCHQTRGGQFIDVGLLDQK